MKILNILFPQMGIEPKSYRVYSQTYLTYRTLQAPILLTLIEFRLKCLVNLNLLTSIDLFSSSSILQDVRSSRIY